MQITAVLKTTVIAAKPTRVLVKATSRRPNLVTLNLALGWRLGRDSKDAQSSDCPYISNSAISLLAAHNTVPSPLGESNSSHLPALSRSTT